MIKYCALSLCQIEIYQLNLSIGKKLHSILNAEIVCENYFRVINFTVNLLVILQ